MRAAWQAYEAEHLPLLRMEKPGLKQSQYRDMLWKTVSTAGCRAVLRCAVLCAALCWSVLRCAVLCAACCWVLRCASVALRTSHCSLHVSPLPTPTVAEGP